MTISQRAIEDLKKTLDNLGIENFSSKFTEEELQELGDLFLTILAEGLKLRAKNTV